MTTSFMQENNQDSSSFGGFVIQDTLNIPIDSANSQISIDSVSYEIQTYETVEIDSAAVLTGETIDTIVPVRTVRIVERTEIDAVSVSGRNIAADIVLASPDHIISESNLGFPFQFVQKNNEMLSAKRERIEKSLKSSEALPATPFRNDWTIGVIILSIILFSISYASVKTFFFGIFRFFFFSGIKEEEIKPIELFHWKSILFSASSLFVIAIFIYIAVLYDGVILVGLSGFKIWLFSVAITAVALILRHFVCTITGLLSGETKIFNDYIITIYQTYRFAGFFLFIVITLFFYTPLITAKSCLITGCIIVAILYLIRFFRLFLLFINHKISIFYLILYFCALEILPVLILIKYFSVII